MVWTAFTDAPEEAAKEPAVWRSSWTVSPTRPAFLAAGSKILFPKLLRRRRPPYGEVNTKSREADELLVHEDGKPGPDH
jgi:hypothetical protein